MRDNKNLKILVILFLAAGLVGTIQNRIKTHDLRTTSQATTKTKLAYDQCILDNLKGDPSVCEGLKAKLEKQSKQVQKAEDEFFN